MIASRQITATLVWALVASLTCASFAQATRDAATVRPILALGDSITKGVRAGVKAEETFSARLEAELRAADVAAPVVNAGIGGERTDQALARFERDVLARQPQIVLIMYGTNDSYVDQGATEPRLTVEQFRANLLELVQRMRAADIVPVLMTAPRWAADASPNGAGEHPNTRLQDYAAACRKVASEHEVLLVDHFAHWTEAESNGTDLNSWTTDGYHPNPRGHVEMARIILPVVLKACRKQPSP